MRWKGGVSWNEPARNWLGLGMIFYVADFLNISFNSEPSRRFSLPRSHDGLASDNCDSSARVERNSNVKSKIRCFPHRFSYATDSDLFAPAASVKRLSPGST